MVMVLEFVGLNFTMLTDRHLELHFVHLFCLFLCIHIYLFILFVCFRRRRNQR